MNYNVYVISAESAASLQSRLQNFLKINGGIIIQKMTQSTASLHNADGEYYVVTLTILYTV